MSISSEDSDATIDENFLDIEQEEENKLIDLALNYKKPYKVSKPVEQNENTVKTIPKP